MAWALSENLIDKLLPSTPRHALEIGCFQGDTTCRLAKRFQTVTCVDPWDNEYVRNVPGLSVSPPSTWQNQYGRFKKTTAPYQSKILECRGISQDILPKLSNASYDFIYIDGDHRAETVRIDALESHRLLRSGGTLLFDDYNWKPSIGPKVAIDQFCKTHADKYRELFRNPQYVALQKI